MGSILIKQRYCRCRELHGNCMDCYIHLKTVHKAEKGIKQRVPVVVKIYKVYKAVHVGVVLLKL